MRLGTVLVLVTALALVALGVPSVSAQASGWQPGPSALGDNTYAGVIDIPAPGSTAPGSGSFTVAGWFVDQTADGWAGADDMQVWLGTMDGGGQMLAKATFAQNRPDVAAALGNLFWAASGWGANVNGSSVPAGNQTLYAYAHTPGKGWWYSTVSVVGGGSATSAAAPAPSPGGAPTLKILNPIEGQDVSTKSDYTVNGQASPPNAAIDVWLNGERNSQYASELGTTTASGGAWSLTFIPTHYKSQHSNLYVYAKDPATGQETLASVGFNIVDR